MSEHIVENDAPGCAGLSATESCAATVLYVVNTGPGERHACGRHIGWLLGRLLSTGESAQVTRIFPSGETRP